MPASEQALWHTLHQKLLRSEARQKHMLRELHHMHHSGAGAKLLLILIIIGCGWYAGLHTFFSQESAVYTRAQDFFQKHAEQSFRTESPEKTFSIQTLQQTLTDASTLPLSLQTQKITLPPSVQETTFSLSDNQTIRVQESFTDFLQFSSQLWKRLQHHITTLTP